jgi:membrane-associated phospholipid phosphatase
MQLLSKFGDIAVLLPASLGLIAFLAWSGSRRDAAAYAAAMAACLTAALFAKLVLAACGGKYSLYGVESPSGHAAFAATFYGCLAALFGAGRTIAWRLALYGGATALVLLVGASRVALEAHNAREVGVGVLIGAMSVALFGALRAKPERLQLTCRTVVGMSPLAALYALCLLLLADHWTIEPFIDSLAARAGADMHLCR